MQRKAINPPNDWGQGFQMNQGELYEGISKILKLSGQVAADVDETAPMGLSVKKAESLPAQIKRVLEKINYLLAEAGMQRENITFIRIYTVDTAEFLSNYGILAAWLDESGIKPPNTLLGVQALALPEIKVEIEIEAAL